MPAPPVFLRSGPPSRERRAGRGAALAQTQGPLHVQRQTPLRRFHPATPQSQTLLATSQPPARRAGPTRSPRLARTDSSRSTHSGKSQPARPCSPTNTSSLRGSGVPPPREASLHWGSEGRTWPPCTRLTLLRHPGRSPGGPESWAPGWPCIEQLLGPRTGVENAALPTQGVSELSAGWKHI